MVSFRLVDADPEGEGLFLGVVVVDDGLGEVEADGEAREVEAQAATGGPQEVAADIEEVFAHGTDIGEDGEGDGGGERDGVFQRAAPEGLAAHRDDAGTPGLGAALAELEAADGAAAADEEAVEHRHVAAVGLDGVEAGSTW